MLSHLYLLSKLTYFINKVCLAKMLLVKEVVNFATDSLVLQNKLLNDANLISDIKLPWPQGEFQLIILEISGHHNHGGRWNLHFKFFLSIYFLKELILFVKIFHKYNRLRRNNSLLI